MARGSAGESVLDRAVRILDAFGPQAPALSVAEIARAADLPIATAHRIVTELERHGLLQRDSDRRVRVGVRLWELAARSSPTRTLREAAMPVMEGLHGVVGHHAQLGVRQDLGTRGEILLVAIAGAGAGTRLHEDAMAALHELPRGGGDHGDAVFLCFDFLRDADVHGDS